MTQQIQKREIEEAQDQCTVSICEDKTKTPYPEQVQPILKELSDIFPRDLPTRLPPQRDVDHHIELVLGAEPPHRAPYRMSPKGLDELKQQTTRLDRKGLYTTVSLIIRAARALHP